MITKELIENLVQEAIKETILFPIEITVNPDNKILIFLDSETNVSIDDCIKVSRFVEHSLDREEEDFALQVSSAGLDAPFKIMRQYQKNIGHDVEITKADGEKLIATLLEVSENAIKVKPLPPVSRKKTKNLPELPSEVELNFDAIKQTKIVISFK